MFKFPYISFYVVSVLFGFTLNFAVPLPVRLFALLVVCAGSFYVFISDIRLKTDLDLYALCFVLVILGLVTLAFGTEPIEVQIEGVSFYLAVIVGFLLSKFYEQARRILIYVIVLNAFFLFGDVTTGEYLISPEVGYGYEADRGRGLFSYSKECGSFILFCSLMYRNSFRILILLLCSAVMTGSRAPMIFVSLILVFEYIYYKRKLTKGSVLAFSLFVTIFLYFSTLYFSFRQSMFYRILGSFNFDESGTHGFRFYIWDAYVSGLSNFNVVHLLFGNPFYLNRLLGNGPENQFLDLLSHGGLFMFFLGTLPIIFLASLSVFKFHRYYPFILVLCVMMFARYGSGWSDGIILWLVIFHLYRPNRVFVGYLSRKRFT